MSSCEYCNNMQVIFSIEDKEWKECPKCKNNKTNSEWSENKLETEDGIYNKDTLRLSKRIGNCSATVYIPKEYTREFKVYLDFCEDDSYLWFGLEDPTETNIKNFISDMVEFITKHDVRMITGSIRTKE